MRLDAAIALLLAVFASAGASSSNDQIRQDNAKNVLLVIIDDCRAHLVTDCAEGGDDDCATPYIQRFLGTARGFARAYSQYPDCAPSRSVERPYVHALPRTTRKSLSLSLSLSLVCSLVARRVLLGKTIRCASGLAS